MKEQYIRQVKHHIYLPRKQKQEVLRDLEEIFASAQEHGETESQVMERLGDPKEYAREVQNPLDQRRGGTALVGLLCFPALYALVQSRCSSPLYKLGSHKIPLVLPKAAHLFRSWEELTSPLCS